MIVDNYSLNLPASYTPFTQGMVTLSFDDGWLSTYQNGIPILNAAGLKSTQYIVNNFLGTPDYDTVADVLAMQASGHEIGSHTLTHPDLLTLSEAQMRQEITQSRAGLLTLGLSPVKTFAFPYGNYNDLALQIVKESGFTSSRTANPVDSGYNYKNSDPFLLKNFSVETTTTMTDVKNWVDTAIANKTWAILVMHQVDTSGSQYSLTPAMLQSIVDYLKQTGIPVVTLSQGLNMMGN